MTTSITAGSELRELQLEPELKELRRATLSEAFEDAESVGELEACVIVQIPVHHRGDAPELSAPQVSTIQIGVREPEHGFPSTAAPFEHGMCGRDRPEVPAHCGIWARFARYDPRR